MKESIVGTRLQSRKSFYLASNLVGLRGIVFRLLSGEVGFGGGWFLWGWMFVDVEVSSNLASFDGGWMAGGGEMHI